MDELNHDAFGTQELDFPPSPLISDVSKDLLRSLLARDPQQRLGSQVLEAERSHDGVTQIKGHKWFASVNFDKVGAMRMYRDLSLSARFLSSYRAVEHAA